MSELQTKQVSTAAADSASAAVALLPALSPPADILEPCAAHVAAANAALQRLEAELDSAESDGTAAAMDAVNDATAELRAAFAFIDQLEESVKAAGLLVEATERRLEVFERGERLPDSLATLPPAMFTNHQFTRQVRRREKAPPPDLPELTLLPPTRAETEVAARAATAAEQPDWAPLPAEVDELQRIAAANVAAATAKAEELQRLAASSLASARDQAAQQAPQLMAAAEQAQQAAQQTAERAREKAKALFSGASGWSSGFWGSGR